MVARELEILYFALQIFSIASLSILTLTFLFGLKQPGTSRPNPLLAANTSSYVASGIVSSLLLFTNTLHGDEPPAALCQAQSALMLAFSPALSALALSLVLTVWRLAWLVHSDSAPLLSPSQFDALVVAIPYVTFILFTVAGAIVGAHSTVSRSNFYCITDNTRMKTASAAVSAIYLFTTCVFLVWTITLVYRRYRESRKFGREQIGTDVPLFIRVLSFGIFVFLALILSVIAIINWTMVVPDVLVAAFGPVIFFVFASQEEILRAWKIKSPHPRTQDRSDSVATLNSARPPPLHPRNSNTFSFISSPTAMADLHSYRFPPISPPD